MTKVIRSTILFATWHIWYLSTDAGDRYCADRCICVSMSIILLGSGVAVDGLITEQEPFYFRRLFSSLKSILSFFSRRMQAHFSFSLLLSFYILPSLRGDKNVKDQWKRESLSKFKNKTLKFEKKRNNLFIVSD